MAVTESSGKGYALYNGVKLPSIDSVWTDKATYPYSVITFDNNGLYHVYFMSTKFTFLDRYEWRYSGTAKMTSYTVNNGVWKKFATETGTSGSWGLGTGVWSSYDVLNYSDNSVYLYASSPIPLDGMTVIEWDGDTSGLTEAANGLSVLISEKIPNISKPAYQSMVSTDDGLRYYGSAEKATESEGNYYWYNFLWHTYVPTATDNYATPGIWSVKGIMSYALFAFYEGTTEETTFDLKSWLIGYALGLSGKPLPIKVPVGYLYAHVARDGETPTHTIDGVGYVGAVLPDINEVWTDEVKAEYPYACIIYYPETNVYGLYFMQNPASYTAYYDSFSGPAVVDLGNCSSYFLYPNSNSWAFYENSVTHATEISGSFVVWCSYDMSNTDDNSVYLAALDPIPINE